MGRVSFLSGCGLVAAALFIVSPGLSAVGLDVGVARASIQCPPGSNPHMPVITSDVPRLVPAGRGVEESFIYRDGTRVRTTDPSGRRGEIRPDGSIVFPDGTKVNHDSSTGDTTLTHPDGSVSKTSARMPRRVGDNFVWSDGRGTPVNDRAGIPGEIFPDGSVHYKDGTIVAHDPLTGISLITGADGYVRSSRFTGARRDSEGTWRWTDGAGAPGTDTSGGAGDGSSSTGWVRYPDGTMISHNAGTDLTKYIRPDGSVTIANACTRTTFPGTCSGLNVKIDKCLVGNWKMTGGGPMDFLKGLDIPQVTRDSMGSYFIKLRSDGLFRGESIGMDYQLQVTDPECRRRTVDTRGQIHATSGVWSAASGVLRVCFSGGGGANATATASSCGAGPGTSIFSSPGYTGQRGGVEYVCTGNSLVTIARSPSGATMKFKFTRIQPAMPGER